MGFFFTFMFKLWWSTATAFGSIKNPLRYQKSLPSYEIVITNLYFQQESILNLHKLSKTTKDEPGLASHAYLPYKLLWTGL